MTRKSVILLVIIIVAVVCGVAGLFLFLPDGGGEAPPDRPSAPGATPTPSVTVVAPTRPGGGVAPTAGR